MPGTIQRLCDSGIVLRDVQFEDILCVRVSVSYGDYGRLRQLLKMKNDNITVQRIDGVLLLLKRFVNRPLLAVLIVGLLLLSLWIPSRVFFISVEGNQQVLTTRILQKAESCGIYFGARRTTVRSEIVKNNLLEAMPELQWVGVNTKGCVAVISVREDVSQKNIKQAVGFSNIVAERDGIIISSTVTSGVPACAAGDAVKKDQVLVSGWQNLGLLVKTTRSVGEIIAQTEREMELISPLEYTRAGSITNDQTEYSFIVGKNRINLSKGSGISYTGCDKIYTRYYLTLPGGFVLPLAIEAAHTIVYESADCRQTPESVEMLMTDQADQYLLEQTVSGVIQKRQMFFSADEAVGRIYAKYTCVEMIGRERTGEMNIHYGENDGTNR